MVIAGGHSKKRPIKGKTGKVIRLTGAKRDRVIVEGLNLMTHHVRQGQPGKPSGKLQREGSIHISNVMYYAEKLKAPVRVRHTVLADGTRVRGYRHPKTKEFVQIVDDRK